MNPLDLFKTLENSNFTFTKPCNENEKNFMKIQKISMNKLISCGMVDVIDKKYSLSKDGKTASAFGLKNWAKKIKELERRELIFQTFGFYNSWYNIPRLKILIEKSRKSIISKEIWLLMKVVIGALILYSIKIIFGIEL